MDREAIQQTIDESWALIQRRQPRDAVEKLRGLMSELPQQGRQFEVVCSHLSHAYHQMGKVRKAISSLRQAIKASPRNARLHLSLAILHRENQDALRAMMEARKAATLDPALMEARELLAELLLEQGFLDTTVREASDILRSSPRNLRAMDILGTAFLYQGHLGRALETVERMIAVCPTDPAHHFKRAVLLQQRGNSSEAMRVYLQVMDMRPSGEIYERSREAVQALDEMQTRQILTLASEDGLFHAKLLLDAETAVEERGYRLSPGGLLALEQLYLPELPNWSFYGNNTVH